VRRVIPEDVSVALRDVLIGAVQDGTGRAAALGSFEVAGKTGTTRLTENGRYKPGAYIASFAGFFPARDPQLVFIVKLTEPRGEYYGGLAAAPVTRQTLEAALATRSSPIDRAAIAAPTVAVMPTVEPAQRATHLASLQSVDLTTGSSREPARNNPASLELPDISGMPMRDAVRRLHVAGFRLRVVGSGRVRTTEPRAGSVIASDVVVRVVGEGSQ
jgi:membrane peptidoglycan carboxypeptidase